ncbi:MAG: hypothetical protein H8E66_14080 [Planctomycetes bacterium]|nr:hypothetical protein [Planctomycetota bacterium]
MSRRSHIKTVFSSIRIQRRSRAKYRSRPILFETLESRQLLAVNVAWGGRKLSDHWDGGRRRDRRRACLHQWSELCRSKRVGLLGRAERHAGRRSRGHKRSHFDFGQWP